MVSPFDFYIKELQEDAVQRQHVGSKSIFAHLIYPCIQDYLVIYDHSTYHEMITVDICIHVP